MSDTYRYADELRPGDRVTHRGTVDTVFVKGRGDEWVTVTVRFTNGSTATYESGDRVLLTTPRKDTP